jgi:hypothetical protein
MPADPFLLMLETSAAEAAAAEAEARREAQRRLASLETARAFAFRRLNLMRAVTGAVAVAETEDIAVASALAVLREKLGWHTDSEARQEVLSRFVSVVRAVRTGRDAVSEPDVAGALADFETWYADAHPVPFWELFEHPIPDTPVVDF